MNNSVRNQIIYTPPVKDISLSDCVFYHTMEIPGIGLVQGQWDLRSGRSVYLGEVDFSGQRVLEIGPASGFFTFYMESCGAEVVACELPAGDRWDIVPFVGADLKPYWEARNWGQQRLANGFWLAHQAHHSRAGVIYQPVYELTSSLGRFDMATINAVLLHLRDPFLALERVLALTQETVIITELFPSSYMPPVVRQVVGPKANLESLEYGAFGAVSDEIAAIIAQQPPQMFLEPRGDRQEPKDMWWQLTPTLIQEFLAILGFVTEKISYHYQLFKPRYQHPNPEERDDKNVFVPLFTIVGRRKVKMDELH